MLPLGTTAPDFKLPDTNGKTVSLADFKDKAALLVIFMCNHCPYVIHIRAGLAQLARDYMPKGVAIVGINSNDAENYPADSPAKMKDEVKSAGYIFPYLYDETQAVAKAYRAACTPDIFLFDRGRRLVYRGQFDASRPGNGIPGDRKGFARRARRRARGQTDLRISDRQHRLQHQVEGRQRAGLFLIYDLRYTIDAPLPKPAGNVNRIS